MIVRVLASRSFSLQLSIDLKVPKVLMLAPVTKFYLSNGNE